MSDIAGISGVNSGVISALNFQTFLRFPKITDIPHCRFIVTVIARGSYLRHAEESQDEESANKTRHATPTSRPVVMTPRSFNLNPVIDARPRW